MSVSKSRRPAVPERILPHDAQSIVEYEGATLGGSWILMSIFGAIFIIVFLVPLLFAFPNWYMFAITLAATFLLVLYVFSGIRNRGARVG